MALRVQVIKLHASTGWRFQTCLVTTQEDYTTSLTLDIFLVKAGHSLIWGHPNLGTRIAHSATLIANDFSHPGMANGKFPGFFRQTTQREKRHVARAARCRNKCNVGYCFLNFRNPKSLAKFRDEFHGQQSHSD